LEKNQPNIAKKYDLKVIEDSADTIGYSINGKNAGKYSDIVTNSFYASHIINGAGTGVLFVLMITNFMKKQNC
jgi:CDP-6-deoxy-D-xylo-4-hexulose-3-dehydrase